MIDDGVSYATTCSETCSVSIAAAPDFVWRLLSRVEAWPWFSPFATAVRMRGPGEYEVASPQGIVILYPRFHEARGLLDHLVRLPDGTEVYVPYRVIPNWRGSELLMTNIKSLTDSMSEYAEQLAWMREELDGAKKYVEGSLRSAGERRTEAEQ